MDEAECFWIQQKQPEDAMISTHMQTHHHMQYFQKINESTVYGLSKQKWLVTKSVDVQLIPKTKNMSQLIIVSIVVATS